MSATSPYTTHDAARTLHLSDEGVRHLARDGQLRCSLTPKGQRVFREEDVLRVAAERSRARLRGVKNLRPKKLNVRGEPRQMSLFSLRKVK